MKKYLIVFVILLMIVTGCSTTNQETSNSNSNSKNVSVTKYGNEEGIIAQYERYSSTADREEYTITVTNAEGKKSLLYSTVSFDGEKLHSKSSVKILSDEEYQEIEDLAFSKDFLQLDGDLTTMETEGGATKYITVYYNGTSFRTGGQNIDSKVFTLLEEKLLSYEEK